MCFSLKSRIEWQTVQIQMRRLAVSSGSPLFAKASVLVCRDKSVKWFCYTSIYNPVFVWVGLLLSCWAVNLTMFVWCWFSIWGQGHQNLTALKLVPMSYPWKFDENPLTGSGDTMHLRNFQVQWTLITTTAFIPKNVAIIINLLV